MTEFVGSQSPQTAEQLAGKSIEEITRYLAEWKPEPNSIRLTRNGLGQQLSRLVADEARRFGIEAKRFERLHQTYVQSLIDGLREAVGKHNSFDWGPVFGLFDWVLEQPEGESNFEAHTLTRNSDWTWTRQAMVNLLDHALPSPVAIPFEFHESVCILLCRLARDPNPTPEFEARSRGNKTSPSDLR